MLQNLGIALQITAIGMGLVFVAILLLWGIIALLVRLTADRSLAEPEGSQAAVARRELKKRAAALAVAVALQRAAPRKMPALPSPRTQPISPWQAALRSREMEQRGRPR